MSKNKFDALGQFGKLPTPTPKPVVASSKPATLSVDVIQPGESQYRLYFDETQLRDLADLFEQHGFHGAVWVYQDKDQPNTYRLISGERRWRAAKLAGIKEISVEVIEGYSAKGIAELGYLANSAAKALNLIEDTRAILDLISLDLGVDHAEAKKILYRLNKNKVGQDALTSVSGQGERAGQDVLTSNLEQQLKQIEETFDRLKAGSWRNFARNRLPLLNLPSDIMSVVESGQLDGTKAQVIARVEATDVRAEILRDAIANDLSFREIKRHIQELAPKPKGQTSPVLKRYRDLGKRIPDLLQDPAKAAEVEAALARLEALCGE